MKSGAFKITAIVSATALALLLGACSDDSSGSGVDHDEINIKLYDEAGNNTEGSSTATSSSSKAKPSSCSAKTESSANTKSSAKVESSANTSSSVKAGSSANTEKSWREICLDILNEYRATEGVKPLALADDDKQTCTDNQAAKDLASNSAHGHFGDCGESAQNTGPNVNMAWKSDLEEIAKYYIDMMWDEKKLVEDGTRDPDKKEDFSYIGHYLNIRNAKYTKVSCGFATSSDKKKGWLNINFF